MTLRRGRARLEIDLLGQLEVRRAGERLALPKSKESRALERLRAADTKGQLDLERGATAR